MLLGVALIVFGVVVSYFTGKPLRDNPETESKSDIGAGCLGVILSWAFIIIGVVMFFMGYAGLGAYPFMMLLN